MLSPFKIKNPAYCEGVLRDKQGQIFLLQRHMRESGICNNHTNPCSVESLRQRQKPLKKTRQVFRLRLLYSQHGSRTAQDSNLIPIFSRKIARTFIFILS